MAQQTHATLPLFLFLAFGNTMIDCRGYQMPTVETIPNGLILKPIGGTLNITCRVRIYFKGSGSLRDVRSEYKRFYLKNCTSHIRLHIQDVTRNCNYDRSTDSCTYEWTSEPYILDSEGDFQLGCMNHRDEDHDGCSLVELLRVIVSRPALTSTRIPSTTTVTPSFSITTAASATTSITSIDPSTTYSHTSYSDGGSSNYVTTGSRYLTSNPVSSQPAVERTSKDAFSTVTGNSSASNSSSDHRISKRRDSNLILIVPPVVFLIVVVMAALLAMFWKCRRRRSSNSAI